jgi:hypothetical protein
MIFEEANGETDRLFKHEQLFDEKARDDHQRGWSASLDKLANFLKAA